MKCIEKEIPNEAKLTGYHAYWNIGKGLPGVAILSKQKAKSVEYDLPKPFNEEKRLITAEFEDFYLISTYVVNAGKFEFNSKEYLQKFNNRIGRGLKTLDKRLEWNKIFDEYVKKLDKKKPVIIGKFLNKSIITYM